MTEFTHPAYVGTSYGDEDQNDIMQLIDTEKGETEMSDIKKLEMEVETYRQAIQDAKDALASAEQELDDLLAYEYDGE